MITDRELKKVTTKLTNALKALKIANIELDTIVELMRQRNRTVDAAIKKNALIKDVKNKPRLTLVHS